MVASKGRNAPDGPAAPKHVAIIMDGNNRWARQRGLKAAGGHRAGVEVIRGLLRSCRERGVEVVTLFAFSSENWQRPSLEVQALMRLFSNYLESETAQLHEDGVRMRFIGERDRFSAGLRKQMEHSEQLTRNNTQTTLVIAVDYGGLLRLVPEARQIKALESTCKLLSNMGHDLVEWQQWPISGQDYFQNFTNKSS